MFRPIQIRGKRAQVGETMTWVVATIIVIILTVVFLFIVNVIAKASKGSVSDFEDSGVETQQMTFVLLNYQSSSGKINDLIKSGDLVNAKLGINEVLNKFSQLGVRCNFVLQDNQGSELINIDNNVKGNKFKTQIEDKTEVMTCVAS